MKTHEWCPTESCTPYKAPEQLCGTCLAVAKAVKKAVKENVEAALEAERKRITDELAKMFGNSKR
jgi:hypothetical protein